MDQLRVLLVDDEEDFRIPISRLLGKAGMVVEGIGSAEQMETVLESFLPDVIVLDVNLPGESGFDILENLHERTQASVIMLTARGDIQDRLEGLGHGADYYLSKPVDTRELIMIIQNVCVRARKPDEPDQTDWCFDRAEWTLVSPDGETCHLSAQERALITTLLARPGRTVGRDELMIALGKPNLGIQDRTLDITISRLRKKFNASKHRLPIRSARGVGYVFPPPVFLKGEDD